METVRRQFIDGDHGQILCRVVGTKGSHPPLLCLHMSPKSGRSFHDIMPFLAKDRLVIAPDYPGYGESDAPPANPPVRVEDYAKACWQVAAAFTDGPIDLLGHHTGSKVAVEMAYTRPKHVRSIILISTAVLTPEEQASFETTYQPIPLDEDGTRFQTMWSRIVEHRGPGMTLEMMADALAENLRGGENYEWGHRAAFAYNSVFAKRVESLPHPITVVNPRDDLEDITPRVMPLLQHGTLVEKPEWGHGFLSAHRQEAAKLFIQALDRSSLRKR